MLLHWLFPTCPLGSSTCSRESPWLCYHQQPFQIPPTPLMPGFGLGMAFTTLNAWEPPVAAPASRTNQTGPCKLSPFLISRFRWWVRSWIPRIFPEEQGVTTWKFREAHSPWGEAGPLRDWTWRGSEVTVMPSFFLCLLSAPAMNMVQQVYLKTSRKAEHWLHFLTMLWPVWCSLFGLPLLSASLPFPPHSCYPGITITQERTSM